MKFKSSFIIAFANLGSLLVHQKLVIPYLIVSSVYFGIVFIAGSMHEGLATTFIGIIYDRKGYQITFEKGFHKKSYVCEVGLFDKTRSFVYIRATKNLIAYGALAIQRKDKNAICILCDMCKERISKDESISLILIVLDYLYYKQFKTVDNDILNNSNINRYGNDAMAFIIDINRKIKDGD